MTLGAGRGGTAMVMYRSKKTGGRLNGPFLPILCGGFDGRSFRFDESMEKARQVLCCWLL